MPPRPRGLSEADQALWTNYTSQLAPLRKRRRTKVSGTTKIESVPSAARLASSALVSAALARTANSKPLVPVGKSRIAAATLVVGIQPGGIDKATWHRFQSGKLTAVRTLDLHGMTVNRAFQALLHFLRTAHTDQVRCVEVVTGRGSGETGGVIRRELPHWLNLPDIRPLILGAAHPHKLNQGSVRLILRRIR